MPGVDFANEQVRRARLWLMRRHPAQALDCFASLAMTEIDWFR